MRTKEIIIEEAANVLKEQAGYMYQTLIIQKLALEALLDIRELLQKDEVGPE